jgi:beta-glucosidase
MGKIVKQRGFTGTPDPAPAAYEVVHAQLSKLAAREGIVLLKNENHILPLAEGSKLALYGAGASKTIKGGTGSGDVNERYSVTIYEGLKNAGYEITSESWIQTYEAIYQQARLDWKEEITKKCSTGLDFFTAYSSTPFYMPVGAPVTKTDADTAIYVLSRIAGEGADRFAKGGDYYLSEEEHQLLTDICKNYNNVVVIINTGGVVDLSFMDEFSNIKGLLYAVQPGMEGGNAVADIISGKVSPSGKLTDTWAYSYSDYPNAATFSHNNGNIQQERYEEGIYVGYRYFDSFDIPPRYGFGFGLSYTCFDLHVTHVHADKQGTVTVKAAVSNQGEQSGKEVVQVYVSLPVGKQDKEFRRLCAFKKTKLLAPNEKQTLTLTFTPKELASYEEALGGWTLEAGSYGVFVGNSLESSQLVASLKLDEDKLLTKTQTICPLQEPLNLLTQNPDQAKRRYAAVLERCQQLPVIPYDLSEVETTVVDYSDEEQEDEAAQIVSQLSQEQLIALATGDPYKGQGTALGSAGSSVPGSAGETSACALEQGVTNIVLADGPAGLRLSQTYYVQNGQIKMLPFQASFEKGFFCDEISMEGRKYYQYCTAIPVGTMLAQTWNLPLLEEVGEMIGEEMQQFGVTLWLAPGMNIHRNPLCGRNFEYYSEDPFVSGKIAGAITLGVQSQEGCGTTLKHFACNNQEDNRMGSNSILSERTLREIYLRGFGIAIQDAKPLSMMTSYNLINGVHSANNYDICTKVARCEFGFDGFIMTDWTTTEQGEDCTAAGCIRAGNDMVMPGQLTDHDSIRNALAEGTLSLEQLKKCITRVVRVVLQSNLYE